MFRHILGTASSIILLTIGIPPNISQAQQAVLTYDAYRDCVDKCNDIFNMDSQSGLNCIEGCTYLKAEIKAEDPFPLLTYDVYRDCLSMCKKKLNEPKAEALCVKGCRKIGNKCK